MAEEKVEAPAEQVALGAQPVRKSVTPEQTAAHQSVDVVAASTFFDEIAAACAKARSAVAPESHSDAARLIRNYTSVWADTAKDEKSRL